MASVRGYSAGGMRPFIQEFLQAYEASRSIRERLILIDTLVQGPGAGGRVEG